MMNRLTPVRVPPVPTPATIASIGFENITTCCGNGTRDGLVFDHLTYLPAVAVPSVLELGLLVLGLLLALTLAVTCVLKREATAR